MLYYYIRMAVFSLKRTPLLSFLMIATISIGIAATMVTYTVSYMMTKDPIPSKSERLFTVHLSSWDPSRMYRMEDGKEEIPIFVTYQDAMNLYNEKKGKRQTIIGSHKTMSRSPSQPPGEALSTLLRATTYEFFDMFEVPFLYGSGWTESDDEQGERVVVLSKKRNMKLFNGLNSVGEEVLIGGLLYRVVGVLDDWVVLPRFYLESHDAFMDVRDMFIPFRSNIDNEWIAASDVSMYCWGDFEMNKFSSMLTSECVWLYFWVELESLTQREAYFDFVNNYAMEQRALGRFQREQMNRVLNVPEFIKHNKVVTGDSRLAVWLALAFLVACLLNCMSLMMTKFHGKGAEIGLRRAVGASREDIAWQFGCETILIGLLGGVMGLLLANLGLIITAEIYSHLNPALMTMNVELMVTTLLSSVIASSLFGLYPIYRACKIQPSSQLKSL
ncbi:ABC transporter permease [Pseudoalteromonas luteoviolacea]|uniref:ABC transporter permease n=1 Tax=Pseudoalteromonas luteoviolacea TaxID=43657 RepID=UPI001B370CCE|nr:ABC transporter permease [Pseudoalteromonas luteoviolacea]MBQ4836269.1 ABC transporter permease [Pseudoalteromonas luteoviolacea]